MNGKDIFLGLKYVGDDLIEKAEYGEFPTKAEKTEKKANTRRLIRRPFLVAAIIAMMLLLVGCAIVYVLSMQEIKLGEQEVTYDVYDFDPRSGEAVAYVGQDTMTQQVLTLAGLSNTPAAKAAREWYDFTKEYDPDGTIRREVWGNEPEFPAEYYGYGLYTQEMKDKLDEILLKYDLKLRGNEIGFPTAKLLFRALGIDSVQNPDSEAGLKVTYADYYDNGNLNLYLELSVPNEEGIHEKASGYLRYRSKNCFIPDTAVLTEGQWEEWNYTTAVGDDVLIVCSQDAGSAWIFCDLPTHTATLQMDIIRDVRNEIRDGELVAVFDLMTVEQLKLVADAIDFSREPKVAEGWQEMEGEGAAIGQEINGYRIEVESAITDGFAYQIVLKITAPEGVAIVNPENFNHRVDPSNALSGSCEEDGDGLLNTCHYIMMKDIPLWNRPEDGSYVFPEGHVVPIYWQDMVLRIYDPETRQEHEEVLTEGLWVFDVPLTDADLREIELLTQPITAKACVGWKMDGTDVLEEREITSIKLRSLGIDLVFEETHAAADFLCFTGQFSYIVMKDGTWVEFASYAFDKSIDLDQVAYVQLADKTIIPMPGVDAKTVELIAEMVQAEWDAAYVPAPVFADGIELLTEPITMKSLGGYVTDPSGYMEPLYEYLTMTSIILHPDGLAILGPAAFDSPDNQATVVMRDGSEILLTGMGGSPYCDEPMSQLKAESMIDLSQVDHVLLPDGTKLMVNNAS